jgi:hypothetical protein
MNIKVDINTEEVNQAVVQAIINSAIGEKIKEEVEKGLTEKKGFSSETIIESAIKSTVHAEITKMIHAEIHNRKEIIRKALIPLITDEVIADISTAAFKSMQDSIGQHR